MPMSTTESQYLIRLHGLLASESWVEPTFAAALATSYTVMRAAGTATARPHLTISAYFLDLTGPVVVCDEHVIVEADSMAALRAADPRFAAH